MVEKLRREYDFGSLDEFILSHEACENDFFVYARRETWSLEQVASFGAEYYYFTKSFPQTLAILIQRAFDEDSRFSLTKILYSELGSGERDQMHFRLFRRTLVALGLSPSDIESGPRHTETRDLVDGLRRLYDDKELVRAFGAQYALERQADTMIRKMYEGFKKFTQLTRADFEFFELHLVEEPEHYECMRDCVERSVASQEDFKLVESGARECLSLFAAFWHRQYDEIMNLVS
jgi:pyrroloquinoline quinone (PQQ) biosynthesis protein C